VSTVVVDRWTVLSPAGVPALSRPAQRAANNPGVRRTLGFLSNHKPNTSELQSALGDLVRQIDGKVEIRFYEKAGSAVGAGEVLLSEIAANCGYVVNGTGD
jgi:hypothetical protein